MLYPGLHPVCGCLHIWCGVCVPGELCRPNDGLSAMACEACGLIRIVPHSQFTAFQGMQIALFATHLKSDDHDESQFLVRDTSQGMRAVLFLVTLIDLAVEIVVFCVGVVFLMTSGSPVDVVLNSVAVNFISDIDEIMLAAFVNKAARQRLEKYRFNVKIGVDEGDTRLAHANRSTKRFAKLSSKAPAMWGAIAIAVVGVGQGLAMQEPGANCTLIYPKHTE